MTDHTVPVPGGRLFVVDAGEPTDPPILLMHAGIADLRAWDDLVPLLVASRYRVARFDSRNFGRSETEQVDYSERADVIAVLDALGIRRAALVGNSLGGAVAFDTAIESPDRVVAVVAVAAGLRGFDGGDTPEEVAAYERMEALEEAIVSASDDARFTLVDELVDLEVRFWMDGPGQPDGRVPSDLRTSLAAMDRGHYVPPRLEGRRIRLDPPASERISDLRCPVLAVAGALDASEVAVTARHVASAAPDARAVVLPDVAHMIGMEVPETLAGLVVDFLAPIPRWS